jgi:hypothetical protein
MKKFKEADLRQVAKNNAEYITPQALREFLQSKIEKDNITVLEPAIGSGQLLFDAVDKIFAIDGYDINQNSLQTAKENFGEKLNIYNSDFITSNIDKTYDYAIANYPFSLRASEEQKLFIANDVFLSQFFVKEPKEGSTSLFDIQPVAKPQDVNGVLDFMFILKSFQYATEGLYFCFPGIGYRGQEEKFRKYLIKNKLIKEYGMINNCQFDHTSISILFLHLTKAPNEQTKSFTLDLKTGERLEMLATFENNQFDYPRNEVEKEYIDAVALEIEIRESVIRNLVKEIEASRRVYGIDAELRNELPTMEEWKQEIIEAIQKC